MHTAPVTAPKSTAGHPQEFVELDWPGHGVVTVEAVNMTRPAGHAGPLIEAHAFEAKQGVLVAGVDWYTVEPMEGAGRVGSYGEILPGGNPGDSYEIIGKKWGAGIRFWLAGLLYRLPLRLFRELPDRALLFAEVHGGEGPRAPQIHVRADDLLFCGFNSFCKSSGVLTLVAHRAMPPEAGP